jgi:hypothetical protein
VTLVLVSRDALEDAIEELYAIVSGDFTPDIHRELAPDDSIVTLAVQAGIRIPGPLRPGTVPPPPPSGPMQEAVAAVQRDGLGQMEGLTSGTYRKFNDPRLRCVEDEKVVYTSMEQAEHAAKRISDRQPMRAYLGRCGHYHVSRIRHHMRGE